MSKNFERWTELAAQAAKEQDSVRLTQLASEMNRALNEKQLDLDPPDETVPTVHS